MYPCPRRGHFAEGLHGMDNFLCPWFQHARFGLTAFIQVHASVWVMIGKHEADAIAVIPLHRVTGVCTRSPGVGISNRSHLTRVRIDGEFCRLAVSFHFAPRYPLGEGFQFVRDIIESDVQHRNLFQVGTIFGRRDDFCLDIDGFMRTLKA